MMRPLIPYAAAGLMVMGFVTGFVTGAGAQGAAQAPDLKGRWVGTGEAIVLGNAPHHASDPASQHRPRMSAVEFTITVEGQEGRRFWGTASSRQHRETFIGIIGFDGKTVTMQDSDGALDGALTDPDTLELVYRHTAPHSSVLSANRVKRQK